MQQEEILALQSMPEFDPTPDMGGQTSWFSIWSDCLLVK
jgi:hypothetical protein